MSSQGRLWSTAPSYRMLIYSGYCCRCWRCPGKDCRGAAKQRSPFWPRWTPLPSTACRLATGCGSATMGSGSNLWTLCTLRSSPTS